MRYVLSNQALFVRVWYVRFNSCFRIFGRQRIILLRPRPFLCIRQLTDYGLPRISFARDWIDDVSSSVSAYTSSSASALAISARSSKAFLFSCKLNSSLCIAWEDSRLAASACRTALLAAAFAFAAETKLVRDSFKISKLSFVRPEIFVPMLLKESSGLSDSAHVARCN